MNVKIDRLPLQYVNEFGERFADFGAERLSPSKFYLPVNICKPVRILESAVKIGVKNNSFYGLKKRC